MEEQLQQAGWGEVLLLLHSSLVRPLWEYCIQFWDPSSGEAGTCWGLATKMPRGLAQLSAEERLRALGCSAWGAANHGAGSWDVADLCCCASVSHVREGSCDAACSEGAWGPTWRVGRWGVRGRVLHHLAVGVRDVTVKTQRHCDTSVPLRDRGAPMQP